LRVLVVSNMLADGAHPERGRFVRDQVVALRALPDLDVQLHEFSPGPRALVGAAARLRRRFAGGQRWDVVHCHFGLSAWPALAVPAGVRALTAHGTDVRHPRTRLATAAVLPFVDLLAAASESLARELPGARARARAQVLPCGADTQRFRPMPREQARAELGLSSDGPYLLFPADPSRAEKRHDRALALAEAVGCPLLTLGGIEPERVPAWVNAANAVLVPSEREGFGLAVVEALACDVPVLATPPSARVCTPTGVAGTLCEPFELARWRHALAPVLAERDPRVAGRAHAQRFSTGAMATRVHAAWTQALERSRHPSG
jgi:teichuronic acid biosynthesis glycosyltransferase TuaC